VTACFPATPISLFAAAGEPLRACFAPVGLGPRLLASFKRPRAVGYIARRNLPAGSRHLRGNVREVDRQREADSQTVTKQRIADEKNGKAMCSEYTLQDSL